MKSISLLLILQLSLTYAQNIPATKRVNWETAGLHGTKHTFSKTVNVKSFGAVADGVTDDYSAIINAIRSLGQAPGIIYFPEGNYLIRSSLTLQENLVLRGACTGSSVLKFDLEGSSVNCINIEKAQSQRFTPLISALSKDSTSIELENPSQYAAGDYVEIRELNGEWDTSPASWASHSVGQIVKVKAVGNKKIILESALRITFDPMLKPEMRKIDPVKNTGIEDLKIERLDAAAETGYNISFIYAAECWIKGVESNKSAGSHIMADASTNLEITGNYIHHSFVYDGSGTRGYGVTLINRSGECLVENNIFRSLRHSMMVKQGANGNVFGYNYSFEPKRTEFPSNLVGDISLHGHFPFANLFEGNIIQTIYIDQEWGSNGPYNTFFRNRAELYGIIMTGNSTESAEQNFIGNEITDRRFLYGNYSLTGSTHYTFSNNVKGTIRPVGTKNMTTDSYYNPDLSFWSLAQPVENL